MAANQAATPREAVAAIASRNLRSGDKEDQIDHTLAMKEIGEVEEEDVVDIGIMATENVAMMTVTTRRTGDSSLNSDSSHQERRMAWDSGQREVEMHHLLGIKIKVGDPAPCCSSPIWTSRSLNKTLWTSSRRVSLTPFVLVSSTTMRETQRELALSK